ncbi:hypothetical protein L596_007955 [Steinernema carpocapsae]|uniref:F-box domain-containing protein n=1 Tax=Steinernema carpocapsae TaxID=34508 RepID=A0A4U5PC04_STECR|nr:hypothetical protein L596_007955 [Steinernema carpocapsae]
MKPRSAYYLSKSSSCGGDNYERVIAWIVCRRRFGEERLAEGHRRRPETRLLIQACFAETSCESPLTTLPSEILSAIFPAADLRNFRHVGETQFFMGTRLTPESVRQTKFGPRKHDWLKRVLTG